MQILAIIPARGGSKGIPRKNIRPIAGKPLIAYIIGSAQQSELITRIIVSTDDADIAKVALELGSEVIRRPMEISGDTAASESALLHTLEHLKKTEDYLPDLVVFLQCTSPLTIAEDIDGTINTLIEKNADSAFTVTPFHHFIWKEDDRNEAIGINHDKTVRKMRQNQDPEYLETGAVYVLRTEGFLRSKHRFFGKTVFHITPHERVWEIDEPIDFSIAETLLLEQKKARKIQALPNPLTGIVLDFDGVFTDNKVMVHEDGSEAVICSRGDGWGLSQIKKIGVPLLVLSSEKNPVVMKRSEKLGIQCKQNISDKVSALEEWLRHHHLKPSDVIYVANDVNDLSCMQYVGCGIAVGDADPEVKACARIILEANGGNGAIRELSDLIRRHIQCQQQSE